jgi:hypothetical protein
MMPPRIPKERIGKILKAILVEIQNAGGEAHIRDIFPIVEPNLDLTEDELSIHETIGQALWKWRTYSYTNDCIKAGFITKSHGRWKLTAQGEEIITKSDEEFTRELNEKYRAWRNTKRQHDLEAEKERNGTVVEQTSANGLIDWYWDNPRFPYTDREREEFCQCGSEKVIKDSSNPEQMRAFLMVGVLIDQMMFTHFCNIYSEFRSRFKYPKLETHGGAGMASPSWFVYSRYDYDKKVDWEVVSTVSEVMLGELYDWFRNNLFGDEMRNFQQKLKEEVSREFEEINKDKLLPIIERIEKESK